MREGKQVLTVKVEMLGRTIDLTVPTEVTIANGELHETLPAGRYVFGNSAQAISPNLGGIVFNILILVRHMAEKTDR